MSETKVPQIPPAPVSAGQELSKWMNAARELMSVREGLKGDPLDANVTFRELVDAGIGVSAYYKPAQNTQSVVTAAAVSDSTPPPDPFNITVSGSVESVLVTWELPQERANLAFLKVWRSVDNNFGNAAIVGSGTGNIYVDYDVTTGTNYHYWLQAISTSDVEGSVIDGGTATPAADPTTQLTQLKSFGIDGQPYYYVPTDTVVNGVTIQKGTYMWNAMIGTATIGTAQIKDAAITSAKVSNLTADKITFNQATGQVFSAAVITGGLIQGTTIQGNTIIGGEIQGSRIWAGGSSTDPNVVIDAETGTLRSYGPDPLGSSNRQYAEIDSGNVTINTHFPQSGYHATRALTNIETGVAGNNATIYLNSFYLEPPTVIVSLNSLQSYSAASSGVDQKIVCGYEALQRQSTDPTKDAYYKYKFNPVAYFTTSASNGYFPLKSQETLVNISYNRYSGKPVYTPVNSTGFTVPANATSIQIKATLNGYEVWDIDSGDGEADLYGVNFYIGLVINGSLVWQSGAYSPTYIKDQYAADISPIVTASAGGSPFPPGPAYIQIVANKFQAFNNSSNVYQYQTANKFLVRLEYVYANAVGNTGLANGSLNWIAIGR